MADSKRPINELRGSEAAGRDGDGTRGVQECPLVKLMVQKVLILVLVMKNVLATSYFIDVLVYLNSERQKAEMMYRVRNSNRALNCYEAYGLDSCGPENYNLYHLIVPYAPKQ